MILQVQKRQQLEPDEAKRPVRYVEKAKTLWNTKSEWSEI